MNDSVFRTVLPVGFDLQFHSDGRVDVLTQEKSEDEGRRFVRLTTCDLPQFQRFLARLIVEQAMAQCSAAAAGFARVERARQIELDR